MAAVLEAYDSVGIRCVFAPHFTELNLLDATPFWRETIPESEHWRISGPAGPLFPPGEDIVARLVAAIAPHRGRFPRITFGLGPSAPERLARATLEQLGEASRAHDLPVYIHVKESRAMAVHGLQHLAEFGGSQIRYLEACGLLGPRVSLAQSVWMTEAEIAMVILSPSEAVRLQVFFKRLRDGNGEPPAEDAADEPLAVAEGRAG